MPKLVAGVSRQWYVRRVAGETPPGIGKIANLAVFATAGAAERHIVVAEAKGDGCEPARQLRLARPRHGSPPAGPVDITRLRWLAKRFLLAVFIHRGDWHRHDRGDACTRVIREPPARGPS